MKKVLLLVLLNFTGTFLLAQRQKCATMKHWNHRIQQDPTLTARQQENDKKIQQWANTNARARQSGNTITIPVVVHVIYHTAIENISDDQVYSQIQGLNEDFRLKNGDSLTPGHPFWPYTADTQIEFCLAKFDPDGNPTNGITRTYTDSLYFSNDDYANNEKYTAKGGKDNWDPTKYLNIWVCNLQGESATLGYATFPSDLQSQPKEDGVVIHFRAFGFLGTAGTGDFPKNDLGRTGTHEVGHWLHLYHIWGDDICGDDLVQDTPSHEGENYDCPAFPLNPNSSCGTDDDGEMFMNYMDYVDDACMVMFSFDQATRMNAAISTARFGLLTSEGCMLKTGVTDSDSGVLAADLFPNPFEQKITVFLPVAAHELSFTVTNLTGQKVFEQNHVTPDNEGKFIFDLNDQPAGIYFLTIATGNSSVQKKIIKTN